jgi:hypothetical protein
MDSGHAIAAALGVRTGTAGAERDKGGFAYQSAVPHARRQPLQPHPRRRQEAPWCAATKIPANKLAPKGKTMRMVPKMSAPRADVGFKSVKKMGEQGVTARPLRRT